MNTSEINNGDNDNMSHNQPHGAIPQQQQHLAARLIAPDLNGGWQSDDYVADRIKIIKKIANLLKARKPNAPQDWLNKLPRMVKRLEETLFRTAPNFESYNNPDTLKQRLQHLALKIKNPHYYTGGNGPWYRKVEFATISSNISAIRESAFDLCRKLPTISIPNNIQIIGEYSFCGCKSLKSISLPSSVTTIESYAFRNCIQLQMITLPKHATVEDDAFAGCAMLDRSNQPDIATWLKRRFDDLPLHQLCYNISDTTTDISTTQINNNQTLKTQDALGMTPIHVLITNPFATPDMIRQLVSNNRNNAAQVRNIFQKTPLHMYLEKIKCPQPISKALLQDGVEYDIHDMINMGLGYEVMDVVLTLSGGRRIGTELNNCNETTGFHPFISGAISHQCQLVDVYKMAIANVDNLLRINTFCGKKRKRM